MQAHPHFSCWYHKQLTLKAAPGSKGLYWFAAQGASFCHAGEDMVGVGKAYRQEPETAGHLHAQSGSRGWWMPVLGSGWYPSPRKWCGIHLRWIFPLYSPNLWGGCFHGDSKSHQVDRTNCEFWWMCILLVHRITGAEMQVERPGAHHPYKHPVATTWALLLWFANRCLPALYPCLKHCWALCLRFCEISAAL